MEDRIEPLDMADLKHAAVCRRELGELSRMGGRIRDGLFDEEVFAPREEDFSDFVMRVGRRADGGGIDKRGKFLQRSRGPGAVFGRHRPGGFAVGIVDGGECRIVEFAVNPRMVDPHVPNPHHAGFDRFHSP